ncbi:MAG TPA: hypothetical protein VLR93_03455 [Patescibacteria group bacterium]|nr:hypothetical protein [Patescibacteria group bacterium]
MSGLGPWVGVAWIVVWIALAYALGRRLSKVDRPRPSGLTMVAASGLGAALVMILLEALGTRATLANGVYAALVATCAAMGWVALASMPVSLPARPWRLRLAPAGRRVLGIVFGPLGFALLLVVGAGLSPADKIDWTTTHLAIVLILGGSLGWVAIQWTGPQDRWSRRLPVGLGTTAHSTRSETTETAARRIGFQRQWVIARSAVRPSDRPAAEAAADALYLAHGLEPPIVRIWLRSPREMALAWPVLDDLRARLAEGWSMTAAWQAAVTNVAGIDPLVVSEIGSQVTPQGLADPGAAGGRPLPSFAPVDLVPPPPEPDPAGIGRWAAGERAAPLGPMADYQLERDGLSQTQRSAYATAIRHVVSAAEQGCLVETAAVWPTSTTRSIGQLAEACDGWWSFDGLSVFQDGPTETHADSTGQFHADDGPAIRYADGWAAWALRGVPMPRIAIDSPNSLRFDDVRTAPSRQRAGLLERFGRERYRREGSRSVELIGAEPDADMRRLLIETYGPDRYVQAVGEIVHEDVDGLGQPRRLWRAARTGDEPLVMVEVRNSTPEADGSRRIYWLRVPPFMRDCQSAVAWTFGVTPDEFVVQAEA